VAEIKRNELIEDQIRDAIKNVRGLKNDRSDVNADIQSIRENLNALGIPKKAFDLALAYADMDEDKRRGFDVAYALVRKVAGLPLQEDLFTAAERVGSTSVAAKKPAEPDAGAIEKHIQSQEAEATKGKKVHEPTGEHQGTIN